MSGTQVGNGYNGMKTTKLLPLGIFEEKREKEIVQFMNNILKVWTTYREGPKKGRGT